MKRQARRHSAERRSSGRPKTLSRDAIVDAACAIGLERLEMACVAERLNTGVATLYGYVKGREHLLQLVADRLAMKALAVEAGTDWRVVLRQHAEMCYSTFRSDPALICNLIEGRGDDEEIVYGRKLVALLEAGGLKRTLAVAAYIEANQVIIGAAVMLARRHVLARHSLDEEGNPVPLPSILGDYRPALERIVKSVAEHGASSAAPD